MDTYNLQTNSAVTSPNQTEKITTGGTSNQVLETPFRINIVGITNNNRVLLSREESYITQEEERNYYKKTLKGKLI